MRLTEICVQRPVFAFMLIMFLVVMGVFSFLDLGVDLFPKTDPATVYVNYRLPGASPEEVRQPGRHAARGGRLQRQRHRRNARHGQRGRRHPDRHLRRWRRTSAKRSRRSARKCLGAVRQMPPSVLPPIVRKADVDADSVVTLALSGDRTPRELTEVADKIVRRVLETVDGVSSVEISRRPQAPDQPLPRHQQAQRLQPDRPGRRARHPQREHRDARRPHDPRPVRNRRPHHGPRREPSTSSTASSSRTSTASPSASATSATPRTAWPKAAPSPIYREKPAVMLEVQRQTGINTVRVVDDIIKRVDVVNNQLPKGINLIVIKESATYIKNSVGVPRRAPRPRLAARLAHHLDLHSRLAHGADQLHRHPHLDHHHVLA